MTASVSNSPVADGPSSIQAGTSAGSRTMGSWTSQAISRQTVRVNVIRDTEGRAREAGGTRHDETDRNFRIAVSICAFASA